MMCKVQTQMLPCRALQLISEYSKPLTRGDWRTCSRIKMDTYIKDKDKLDIINKTLYELVHRNMYERLYGMTKCQLYWLIFHQFESIKCHTIIPLLDMSRHEMIYVAIQNEEIMKRPNYKQKKFFKENQDILKLYIQNNKLKPNHRFKNHYSSRYFTRND